MLLLKFKANDILIGHSLESDLKVLKIEGESSLALNVQSKCVGSMPVGT